MQWLSFPDPRLQVCGLPWFEETKPEVVRFPSRFQEKLPPAVWGLSRSPSGGRIRFRTDASAVAVRLHYASHGRMHNMATIGQMGVDLYAGGRYWRSAFPTEAGDLEFTYFDGAEAREREICLYLPLYHPVKVLALGLADGARVEAPRPFALPKPVVFYGTSITQGGCASRGGLSYQAILCRDLNLDFVNMGFSGSGKGEAEVARALGEIDAACFVLDFALNNGTPEALRQAYEPFVQTLRLDHPRTPILCITPVFHTGEVTGPTGRERLRGMRQVVRDAVAARKANHDERIWLVEGYDLLSPEQGEGLVDGVHPNDLGFQAMARGLKPHLRRVLRLA